MKIIKTFESVVSQKNIEILSKDILKMMVRNSMAFNVIMKNDAQYLIGVYGVYLPDLDVSSYDDELKDFIKSTELTIIPEKNLRSGIKNTRANGAYNERSSIIYLNVSDKLLNEINDKFANPNVYGDITVHYDDKAMYITFWYEFHSTLIHELQHAWDAWKSKGKYTNTKKWNQYQADVKNYNKEIAKDSIKGNTIFNNYLNLSHEINARFTQAIDKTKFWKTELRPPHTQTKKLFKEVRTDFQSHFEGWYNLEDKIQKRLLQRLYNFWVSDYKKRVEKNIVNNETSN